MIRLLLILSLIFLSDVTSVYSQVYQEWVRKYNGTRNSYDRVNSISIDTSGYVYISGFSSESTTNEDYTTIKYNSQGIQQWIGKYDGAGAGVNIDYQNGMVTDVSGNVYVTGESYVSSANTDYVTVKYNSVGIQQWAVRYNSPSNSYDGAKSIAVDNVGNTYVTGESFVSGTQWDYLTIKYNSAGVQQWTARYNGPNGEDKANLIKVDLSGNVYVSGYSVGNGTLKDYTTIKYNSSGIQQWVQRYNGPGNDEDTPTALELDISGNVFVSGFGLGSSFTDEFITIKYNSSGSQQWVQIYNNSPSGREEAHCMKVDILGNVYVAGFSGPNSSDCTLLKYNSAGAQQWIKKYNSSHNGNDGANAMFIDNNQNIYLTGSSEVVGLQLEYFTIKYTPSGIQEWVQIYSGNMLGSDYPTSIAVDKIGNVYVAGLSKSAVTDFDFTTIKYSQQERIMNNPTAFDKWIAGEKDTIKWTSPIWPTVNIRCTLNVGTSAQSIINIATSYSNSTQQYPWNIPDTLLSYRSKIVIENANDPTQKVESGIFRIKPYLLTKINPDSTYYEYKKERDQWGFSNDSTQMWPYTWYQQFNYRWIDPFTGILFSQTQGDSVFNQAKLNDFPDWTSIVNTFTTDKCYKSVTFGYYSPVALNHWKSFKQTWKGSCFGIATANALAFQYKNQFQLRYPNFPQFDQPSSVQTGNSVRKVINELFTHQIGQPHLYYQREVGPLKTPTQTLNEIRAMLLNENAPLRILAFQHNTRGGGHALLAYKVRRDSSNSSIYYVDVYDNQHPLSNFPIVFFTSENGGNGRWDFIDPDWHAWGGNKNIFLMDQAVTYLTNPRIESTTEQISSTFSVDSLVQIRALFSDITIKDALGNISGNINDSVKINIPGTFPIILYNGTITPPLGFSLLPQNYSVTFNKFTRDTISTYFFSGNKTFSYERKGADYTQTDKLYFNGALSFSNPDVQPKSISLHNIINDTSKEKVFSFSSLGLNQNDSIKIENFNENNLKLTSYGSAKNYNVEINLAASTGLGIFNGINIQLPANSSHTFIPNWENLQSSQLIILEDIGNNGTIDDTLRINNIITGENGVGNSSLPGSYCLYQNYPNPFNPETLIKYDIKNNGFVSLKVYDLLGREIYTLVNEVKFPGSYIVEFNSLTLSSGIYFYRLEAGDFIQTKKMMILK